MLNKKYKKEAIAKCEKAGDDYKSTYDKTIGDIEALHKGKKVASEILQDAENVINSISNRPKEFEKDFQQICGRIKKKSLFWKIKARASTGAVQG